MQISAWAERKANDPEYQKALQFLELEQMLADVVVSMRIGKDLSQADLAALAGVTQSTISHLENGDANPTAGTVAKVMAALLSATDSPSLVAKADSYSAPIDVKVADVVGATGVGILAAPAKTFDVKSKSKWHDVRLVQFQPMAA